MGPLPNGPFNGLQTVGLLLTSPGMILQVVFRLHKLRLQTKRWKCTQKPWFLATYKSWDDPARRRVDEPVQIKIETVMKLWFNIFEVHERWGITPDAFC